MLESRTLLDNAIVFLLRVTSPPPSLDNSINLSIVSSLPPSSLPPPLLPPFTQKAASQPSHERPLTPPLRTAVSFSCQGFLSSSSPPGTPSILHFLPSIFFFVLFITRREDRKDREGVPLPLSSPSPSPSFPSYNTVSLTLMLGEVSPEALATHPHLSISSCCSFSSFFLFFLFLPFRFFSIFIYLFVDFCIQDSITVINSIKLMLRDWLPQHSFRFLASYSWAMFKMFSPVGILSYPILSYPILSYPILSYPILSYPILSYPILSYHILPFPSLPFPSLSTYYSLHITFFDSPMINEVAVRFGGRSGVELKYFKPQILWTVDGLPVPSSVREVYFNYSMSHSSFSLFLPFSSPTSFVSG